MKLIHKVTGQTIVEGTVLPDGSTVIYCPQPHKPSSEGKMQVGYSNGENSDLLYCSCFDCKWVDREDREEQPASLRVALPQSSLSPVNSPDQTKLEKIQAKCREILELGRLRTQGEWVTYADGEIHGTDTDGSSIRVAIVHDDGDFRFISSCSGTAEAMARSTLAAIRDWQTLYSVTENYADGAPDASTHDKLCNEIASICRINLNHILSTWPDELLA